MSNPSHGPLRILLVEDNPAHVRLVVERLDELDQPHSLAVTKDGEAALVALGIDPNLPEAPQVSPHDFDLVMVDLNLPILDGRDLIDVMRRHMALKDIPIIILTSSLDDRRLLIEHRLPYSAYIEKPVTARAIQIAIAAYPDLPRS